MYKTAGLYIMGCILAVSTVNICSPAFFFVADVVFPSASAADTSPTQNISFFPKDSAGFSQPHATTASNLENLYQNPKNKKLPEAIIFYNSSNPCSNCNKAVNMIVRILKKNYRGRMHAYLIDIDEHPEFISAFKLQGPLNLVLIRISDGASFGYAKISGLQSETGDAYALAAVITEKIGNFLNLPPEN